jgi:hypothetical protein
MVFAGGKWLVVAGLLALLALLAVVGRKRGSIPYRLRLSASALLLTLLGAGGVGLTSCAYGPVETDASEQWPEGDVLYGPAPADGVEDGSLDALPTDVTDVGEPADLYGPMEVGFEDVKVHYGPVDVAAEQSVDVPQPDNVPADVKGSDTPDQPLYGVQPIDVVQDQAATDAGTADLSTVDCPPAGWYGPPPCASDEECQQQYGADYYCNKDNTVPSPCDDDKPMSYPVCEPKK